MSQQEKLCIDKLIKIVKSLQKKGTVFWFDENNKVITCGLDAVDIKKKAVRKIKKDIGEYLNMPVVSVQIFVNTDDYVKPLEIHISVFKVTYVLDKISLQQRGNNHAFLKLLYDCNELNKFKLKDIPKLANMMLQKEFKTSIFKSYNYRDIEDKL